MLENPVWQAGETRFIAALFPFPPGQSLWLKLVPLLMHLLSFSVKNINKYNNLLVTSNVISLCTKYWKFSFSSRSYPCGVLIIIINQYQMFQSASLTEDHGMFHILQRGEQKYGIFYLKNPVIGSWLCCKLQSNGDKNIFINRTRNDWTQFNFCYLCCFGAYFRLCETQKQGIPRALHL